VGSSKRPGLIAALATTNSGPPPAGAGASLRPHGSGSHMSLKHAVLASLLDGEASGYELAKRMNISVAQFWHAQPAQIYTELRRLESDGLVIGREVPQHGKPDKRLYPVSDGGYDELIRFGQKKPRPTSVKDELLIQIQSADFADAEAVADALDERSTEAAQRLVVFERLIERFLAGASEDDYLQRATRIGPYLNLKRGRDFERDNVAWYAWAAEALRARAGRRKPRRRVVRDA
jgi:DNA-binding PadR family transcriptional regulator